jgi:protein TonB
MPAELFRTVAVRRSPAGHRVGAVPLSVAIHAAVLVAAVTIPLLATDVLPMPQVPLVVRLPAMPVVVVPSVPPPRAVHSPLELASWPGVPVVAPSGITDSAIEPPPPGIRDVPIGELVGSVSGTNQLSTDGDFVPPPPPPKASGPVRPGGDIQAPRKIHNQVPVYPPMAIAARVEGTVVIDAIISATGTVQDMRVVSSIPLLDRAALDAVRQWVFTPTRLNGVPVPVILTVNVEFKLQ